VRRVQEGTAEVTAAKKGKSGATLSQAYACCRFARAVLGGLAGSRIRESCFLKSDVCEGVPYFASQVTFGKKGVEQVHPVGKVSKREAELLAEAVGVLRQEVEDGLQYAEGLSMSTGGASG